MAYKKLHPPKNPIEFARLNMREKLLRKKFRGADARGDHNAAIIAFNALISIRSQMSVMTGDCAAGD